MNGASPNDRSVSYALEPVDASLFGKRIFVNIIKRRSILDAMDSSWIIQVDPESNDRRSYKRHPEGHSRGTHVSTETTTGAMQP